MAQRTTIDRPITDKQRRIYDAWSQDPSISRRILADNLGVSREYIKQVLAVVQTKLAHQART